MSASSSSSSEKKVSPPLSEVLKTAGKRAIGGGVPGAMAMAVQVTTLIGLRATMNYQYRYGTTTSQAFRTLYNDGGWRRFYRGYGAAMLQGPLSRFGDTAANAGMLSFLDSHPVLSQMPTAAKTVCASATAASWRIFLMPVDACKTILQVEGKDGLKVLRQKMSVGGPRVLYHGALAASLATFVGHFPWFYTFNQLNVLLPRVRDDQPHYYNLVRNGSIGFVASVVSDTVSNSIRVVKTTKQAYSTPISYLDSVKVVLEADGVKGLFGRGLQTRIIANGMQGLLFAVLWKEFQTRLFPDHNKK